MNSHTVCTPINKGYSESGASLKKRTLKGFIPSSGSANEDINYNNRILRQRARQLIMSGGLATSAIKTNRTNVIGSGLRLKSRIDTEVLGISQENAEKWQRNTEREFALWANNKKTCDALGINNFYSMQGLALTTWLGSGDAFCLFKRYKPTKMMPYSLRLHLLEPDRISTPYAAMGSTCCMSSTDGKNPKTKNEIFDGVEVNSDGQIVAYHIRNNYPYEYNSKKTKWARVEATARLTELSNILQIMDSERCEQYRGVSYIAPVIEFILQIRKYTEGELAAAVIESYFTAFIQTEAQTDTMPMNEAKGDGQEEVSDDDDEYELGPATVNVLKPGEKVAFGDPKRPTSGFPAFVRSVAVQIGATLELPADILLKEFNASYSASRAALLEAWKAFKTKRFWFIHCFNNPVYEVWMYEAVAIGRICAPGFFDNPIMRSAWLGCEWVGPTAGQLDPVKEITAEILACEHAMSTRTDSTIRLNGSQWDANIEQIKRENVKLQDAQPKTDNAVNKLSSFVKSYTQNGAIAEIKKALDSKED